MADSFLKAFHVTRTWQAHQVTSSSLYLLLEKAYTQYYNNLDDESKLSLEDWRPERCGIRPHFRFWSIILQLELDVLIYVRAMKERDFQLYIEALTKIVPWFFTLDHTNYSLMDTSPLA